MSTQDQARGLMIRVGKTKKVVLTAMLFAVALVLSIVESMIPSVPIPVPGVKFGLSNIVIMYSLFFLGKSTAFTLAVLKATFAVITRGAVAGLLSFTGGIFSILIMIILMCIFKDNISYFILSVFGAVFHNIGQFTAISIVYVGMNLWFYLPFLLILGVVAGIVTSSLLKFILPALKDVGFK